MPTLASPLTLSASWFYPMFKPGQMFGFRVICGTNRSILNCLRAAIFSVKPRPGLLYCENNFSNISDRASLTAARQVRQTQLHNVKLNHLSCFNMSFLSFLPVSLAVFLWLTLTLASAHRILCQSVNSTWQCVAPSNTANVTLLLRSQAVKWRWGWGGKAKIMKALDLVFDIEDDILLIFFLLLSPLTSLDIGLDVCKSVAEAGLSSAHDVWGRKKKKSKKGR